MFTWGILTFFFLWCGENYEALNLAVKSGVDARIIPTISIAKVSLM
jgi:diphthamide synthase (EF-2-diphthine--ammonia ligase)